MTEIAHYIDNARVAGARPAAASRSGTRRRGESDKTVALASTDEVGQAIAAAAKAAWPAWAKTPALRRARILDRFKMILWERAWTNSPT